MKPFIFVFVFCIFIPCTEAQNLPDSKIVNHQYQVWVSVNSSIKIKGNWGLMADAHIRRNNGIKDPSFYFGRIGAMYWLNKQISVALGYANLFLAPPPGINTWTDEHRIYQQLLYNSKIGKISMLQRMRNEQRWKQQVDPLKDELTGNYIFTNRFRYLLSFTIPLFNNPSVPSLVLSDEILMQFGKSIVYNPMDQNRIFVGIRQPINKNWSFDFGYMNVYQQKHDGYNYDMNHTLRWFFYYSFTNQDSPKEQHMDGAE